MQGNRKELRLQIKEMLTKDFYCLTKVREEPNYFIDIGANMGMFSLIAKLRHFNSKIIALEPSEQAYNLLEKNLDFIRNQNVELVNKAFGDGNPLYLCVRSEEYAGTNVFYKYKTNTDIMVETITLSQIFLTYGIEKDKNYFLKLDCEGGERFLIGNKETEEIVKNCLQLAMEIHFPPFTEEVDEYWKDFPTYNDYYDWINSTVRETHDIIYHGSRKKTGHGVFVLIRK